MLSYADVTMPIERATVSDARATVLELLAPILHGGATRETLVELARGTEWARATIMPAHLDAMLAEVAAVFALLSFYAGPVQS